MVKVFQKISECLQALNDQGIVLTIGNFDGVHIGHQYLIQESLRKAAQIDCKLAILTFDPHPVEIFAPDVKKFLLLSLEEKLKRQNIFLKRELKSMKIN